MIFFFRMARGLAQNVATSFPGSLRRGETLGKRLKMYRHSKKGKNKISNRIINKTSSTTNSTQVSIPIMLTGSNGVHYFDPCYHSRPQSLLYLLAGRAFAERRPLGPCAQPPAAKRTKRLWGREYPATGPFSTPAFFPFSHDGSQEISYPGSSNSLASGWPPGETGEFEKN